MKTIKYFCDICKKEISLPYYQLIWNGTMDWDNGREDYCDKCSKLVKKELEELKVQQG